MATSLWKIFLVACLLAPPLVSQTSKQQQYKTKEQCDQQARRAFDKGLEGNTLLVSEGKRIPITILVEDMDNKSGVERAFAEVLNQLPGRFDVRDRADVRDRTKRFKTVLYASATDLRKSQTGVQSYQVELYTYYTARVIVNNQPKWITGKFIYSEVGGSVSGSEEDRTRVFKKAAYKVVSEAINELDLQ